MATIGIDVSALSTPASGGIGTSQHQIMLALAQLDTPHRFIMYAARPPVVPFSDRPLDLPWPIRLGSGPLARSNIVWMQTGVNRQLAADRVDLFWGPRHLLPFRFRSAAMVATVHDLWHLRYPEQQPWMNRTANRLLIGRVAERADRVVAVSKATADELVNLLHVPVDRIDVVPQGVDTAVFAPASASVAEHARSGLGLGLPYLLSLDVFNPRKNFGATLRAFAALSPDVRAGLTLLGIGSRRATASEAGPRELAAELGIERQVRFAEDVPLADLIALYSGAVALVYPSVYEGFGMPVLEAMACGCPVITSDRSSLPEVAGDAALLADPGDPAALSGAIARLLADPALAPSLKERGMERAREFTWKRTAQGMLDVFDRTLEGRT